MTIFLQILLFLIGFVLVIFGGNFFVDTSVRIAKRFKMSEILIGATIVSIGTTLPELLTSSIAASQGLSDMAAGNAIGSVICNTALIAALVQAIRPSTFDYSDFRRGTLIFFAAIVVFAVFSYAFHGINLYCGIILVVLFVFYIVFNVVMARRKQKQLENTPLTQFENAEVENLVEDTATETQSEHESKFAVLKRKIEKSRAEHINLWTVFDFVFLFAMAAVLFFGTKLLIDNGVALAETMGISEKLISITLIAIGTSLPELVTAVTSLVKKHSAISLGNIIGANTLNILLVVGVSSIIRPISMNNAWLYIDIPVMAAVTLVFALPALITKKMHRSQGFALLATYIAYTAYLIIAG